ncbi:MAG: beta-N-acetylhexosaminidase [Nannocystaceae bacterium]|nr:beta-N-acetylhexosaminidase [bacterium]
MTSPWQPGQLLFAGFEGKKVPSELATLIEQGRVGGVILFTRNLGDPRHVAGLVRELRRLAPERAPLTVAIDQEGGRVQRFRAPWTQWPPMRQLGDVDDLELTRAFGSALALELTHLGIGLDFAPVMDVDTNPANPVIGDRSFGADAARVAAHGAALIERLQSLKIAACAKHFPGHGDTHQDSHHALPRLPHDLERLRQVELLPFRAAAQAKVAAMMSAHVVFEALDPKRPGTLSPPVMHLIREEIGFEGLVFSDDLEMKAIADHYGPKQFVGGALEAGVDALLVCRKLDLVQETLARLEALPDPTVERAIERMVAFKDAFPPPPLPDPAAPPPAPYAEHEALAQRIADGLPLSR